MVDYRSENGKFNNKPNYKDLNMTLYPNQLDTRSNNSNMKGHVNVGEGHIPDFVMAEYVNSLYDGLMAIERALGITPMVHVGATDLPATIEGQTVASRINRIENGLFDERYGGEGWVYNESRPTLKNHSHTGKNGQPPQINLTQEVLGLLPKQNINLSQSANGLLATDIKVSTNNPNSIATSLNDKLSLNEGGVVLGPTTFNGLLNTRYQKEYCSENLKLYTGAYQYSDNTLTGIAISSHEKNQTTLVQEKLDTLHFGRYVACLRLRLDYNEDETSRQANAFRIRINGSQATLSKFAEFPNGSFRSYYYVFDHQSKEDSLILEKLSTTNRGYVSIDNLLIQPIHPSILDR